MTIICGGQPMLRFGSQETHRRGLDHGDGLDDFLFVQLRARTVEVAHDGGHAGLVAHCGGEMDGLLRVVLGEAARRQCARIGAWTGESIPLDLAPVAGGPLAREEGQRAVAGSLELPVRHGAREMPRTRGGWGKQHEAAWEEWGFRLTAAVWIAAAQIFGVVGAQSTGGLAPPLWLAAGRINVWPANSPIQPHTGH